MQPRPWVRLPSSWINRGDLDLLKWGPDGKGSNNTAALMALTVIAQAADDKTGAARLTYDQLCAATGLSRAKLSKGLDVLERMEVVSRNHDGRSNYKLVNYDPLAHWAKLPAKSMYSAGRIIAFDDFRLRRRVELDALKLYFLFVARRGKDTNMANIGYDKIQAYTGIERGRIKTATSYLASLSLIYVEQVPFKEDGYIANAYRIVGVDPYKHMGTTGRSGR